MSARDTEARAAQARELFLSGYNCAQSVFLIYAADYGLDKKTAMAVSASFGGGMGRLREVCGTVSGVFMAIGLKFGVYPNGDLASKKRHYAIIQELARRFREVNGSIICRELLGLDVKQQPPEPEKRTAEYYKRRPCAKLVETAVRVYDGFLDDYENGKVSF